MHTKTYKKKLCTMIQKSSYSIKNSKPPQNHILNVGQLKEENEKEIKKKPVQANLHVKTMQYQHIRINMCLSVL